MITLRVQPKDKSGIMRDKKHQVKIDAFGE